MATLHKSVEMRQKEEVMGFGQKIECEVVRQKRPLNLRVWLSEKASLRFVYVRVKVMSF